MRKKKTTWKAARKKIIHRRNGNCQEQSNSDSRKIDSFNAAQMKIKQEHLLFSEKLARKIISQRYYQESSDWIFRGFLCWNTWQDYLSQSHEHDRGGQVLQLVEKSRCLALESEANLKLSDREMESKGLYI